MTYRSMCNPYFWFNQYLLRYIITLFLANHIRACMHTCIHTCNTYMHTYMHTKCIHAYMHTGIHTCVHAYIHVHAYFIAHYIHCTPEHLYYMNNFMLWLIIIQTFVFLLQPGIDERLSTKIYTIIIHHTTSRHSGWGGYRQILYL